VIEESNLFAGERRPPPGVFVAIAGLVALAGFVMTFAGALTTGVSTDEPAHVERLNNYLDHGYYGKDFQIDENGNAISNLVYVYGPATTMLMHEANVVMGNEHFTNVERDRGVYTGRHLVIASIASIGLLAVFALGWLLLGDWRWGVVAAGVLSAVPMWTGHSMFNPKDVSVAVGHTLVTLALVALTTSKARTDNRWLVGGGAVFAAGIVLMMGTRPGMWVTLFASMALFFALLGWARALSRRVAVTVGVSLLVAYLGLIVVYPRIFSHPLTMLWISATTSADFVNPVRASERSYIPVNTAQEWPLMLLGLWLAGTVIALVVAGRKLRDRSPQAAALVLVGSQAFTLLVLAIIRDVEMYNGLRQVLFAVPAQAVLATVALAALFGSERWTGSHGRRILAVVLGSAALVLPTAVQAAMFPYQYTYINAASELAHVQTDNDYWDTSFREYLPYVSTEYKLVCTRKVLPDGTIHSDHRDCRTRRGGTFSAFWGASKQPAYERPETGVFYAITRDSMGVPRNCATVHTITRWRNLSRVTMSRLLKCHEKPVKPEEEAKASSTSGAESIAGG
jgi:hypothetical protein